LRLRDLFKTPTTLRILDVLLEDPGRKPHALSSLAEAAGASRLSTRREVGGFEALSPKLRYGGVCSEETILHR